MTPPCSRFVTRDNVLIEELPWGPHHWLCRPGLVDNERLALVRVHMPPGTGHAFHRHPGMEEIIYVVEGKAEQWVDRERRVLAAGEIAHIPPDMVHATYNPFDVPLVFLAILSPGTLEGGAVDVSGEEPWRTLRRAAV
jgi:quercetin dioxygenase-like cupin family protein